MPEQNEYTEFRKLLRTAIGPRTQAQFAAEADIAPAHLNRLLNNPLISRPNKSTLMKIAGHAYTPISLKSLYAACDYPVDVQLELKKLSFSERSKHCIGLLKSGLDQMTASSLRYDTVYAFCEALVERCVDEEVSVSVKDGIIPQDEECADADKVAVITFSWGNRKYSAALDVLLLYCVTAAGAVIVVSYYMDQERLGRYGSEIVQTLEENEQYAPDQYAFVGYRVRNSVRTAHVEKTSLSPEDRLMLAIFGEDTPKRPFSAEGIGLDLSEVKDVTLKRFFRLHKETFCRSDREREIYDAFVNGGAPSDEAFAKIETDDPEITGEGTWGGAAANIVYRETGLRLWFFSRDDCEAYKNINCDCIMFGQKMPWLYSELERSFSRETLYQTLDSYARELRTEVTDCFFVLDVTAARRMDRPSV